MAISNLVQYCGSVQWTAVTAWVTLTVTTVGTLRRQSAAPTVGNERVFVATVAGTTGVSEPTWTVTKGGVTSGDGTVTWTECTGQPGVNGDVTNTPVWITGQVYAVGDIIKDTVADTYFICSTAGTSSGAEPSWNKTAGLTTASGTATFTSIGAVGTFGIWAAPHARQENMMASGWLSAGGIGYTASNHTQTTTTTTSYTGPGTTTAPCHLLSVSAAASPPTTLTAGAAITVGTGSANNINLTLLGECNYWNGFTFTNNPVLSGSIILATSIQGIRLENCSLVTLGTSGTHITLGSRTTIELVNTTMSFADVSSNVNSGTGQIGTFIWRDTPSALVGAAVPTTLFLLTTAATGSKFILRALDLSAVGSGKNLFSFAGTSSSVQVTMSDCKLGAGVTVVGSAATEWGTSTLNLIRCDSAATNYRQEFYSYGGSIVGDTANFNQAGASDGTTPLSEKMVSTANTKFEFPLYWPNEPDNLFEWNDVSGVSKTISVEIMNDGLTLTNADIYMDVTYLGSALTPQGSGISTAAATLASIQGASGTAYATSSATWTTSGVSSPVKQTISATFTPHMKGPIQAIMKLARPSATVWIDPLMTIV